MGFGIGMHVVREYSKKTNKTIAYWGPFLYKRNAKAFANKKIRENEQPISLTKGKVGFKVLS